MAHFFTIVCEYKGGTYTKQLRAESPTHAFEQWAGVFRNEDFLTAPEKKYFAEEVQYSLSEGNLVALEGLQNVWYEGFSLGEDLLEVMIIAMSEQPVENKQPVSQHINGI
ncbi:MAG: hypothetical protein EPGJADBJ_00768 [Saprospiraceae bacterium]|nr:hypothetical protein [Saprospiraceae bacterium]